MTCLSKYVYVCIHTYCLYSLYDLYTSYIFVLKSIPRICTYIIVFVRIWFSVRIRRICLYTFVFESIFLGCLLVLCLCIYPENSYIDQYTNKFAFLYWYNIQKHVQYTDIYKHIRLSLFFFCTETC